MDHPVPWSQRTLLGQTRTRPSWFPRVSGWLDQGYTYANTGTGRLAIAPEMNRFGDRYQLNQVALNLDKPCAGPDYNWGYYLQLFAGADAYTLTGPGDIRNTNPNFGGVVRQARVQCHLPLLTDEGVDVVVGRQGSPMGYESYMAPQRPFYSLSYQWFYAEDGADTGCWTTVHLDCRWDLMAGATLGSNTFFTLRDHGACEIVQLKRWLNEAHRDYWCATLINGPQSVGKNFIAYPGSLATVVELRGQVAITDRWTQVVQANLGWDQRTQIAGLGRWAGVLGSSIYRISADWAIQARYEWFDDANGVRTGVAANYEELTGGLVRNWGERLQLRPEIRGDFADRPAFGPLDSPHRRRGQLTLAMDCVWAF